MSHLRRILSLSLALAALAILPGLGCGKSHTAISQAQSQAFDSAPAEVKATWDKVVVSDAATNYVETLNNLNKLKVMQLNEQQTDVLFKKIEDFNQRMYSAAAKNDASATQAVQMMRGGR